MLHEIRTALVEEKLLLENPVPQAWTFTFEGKGATHEANALQNLLRDTLGFEQTITLHKDNELSILVVADPQSVNFLKILEDSSNL